MPERASGLSEGGAARTWPARFPPAPAERIERACAACGADWWIHVDLAGSRLRCDCGAWVRVPPDPRSRFPLRGAPPLPSLPPLPPVASPAARRTGAPAPARARRRRPSRGALRTVGLGALLLIPAAALVVTEGAGETALFQPLASLFAGLVVLATGLFSDRHTAGALRGAAPSRFAEGLAAAFGLAALAVGWNHWIGSEPPWPVQLRDGLGYGAALALGALCPAVFEELAFRGLLQGRATAWLGRRTGILAGALVFAAAHGLSAAFPVQLLLGIHLGSLRERGRSLFPCIVEHALFSGLVVVLG